MAGFVAAIALIWAGITVASLLVIGGLLGLFVLALAAVRRDQPAVDSAET